MMCERVCLWIEPQQDPSATLLDEFTIENLSRTNYAKYSSHGPATGQNLIRQCRLSLLLPGDTPVRCPQPTANHSDDVQKLDHPGLSDVWLRHPMQAPKTSSAERCGGSSRIQNDGFASWAAQSLG